MINCTSSRRGEKPIPSCSYRESASSNTERKPAPWTVTPPEYPPPASAIRLLSRHQDLKTLLTRIDTITATSYRIGISP